MTLVSAALEQSPETREGYLRSACAGDAGLYDEVAGRVQWEGRMDGFLCHTVLDAFEYLDRPFEPGELVAGRFRVLSEVGRGGMGVVYEAFDEKLDRRVALKSAVRGHDNRLPPETRAAREISHFNVCKVHDLHSTRTESGEVQFLTMEYIDGETLSARIRRAGPLPPDEAREIARQICAGLAQAHRQGVIHGDLKCGNVILTAMPGAEVRAVITDFGLASMNPAGLEDALTNQLRGSLDYMAPELFSGASPSVASDLYALGVIVHVMLTGKLPTPVKEPRLASDATTLTLGRASIQRPVARRCEKLPAPWSGIVKRCLESAPEDRFASADEVSGRLDAPAGPRPWIVAVAAAALAMVAALLWFGREPQGPAVRLAILPITVEGAPVPAAAGLAVDLADRLSGARRGFVVIPPNEAARNRVDTSERAHTVLSATHLLRTRLRNQGGQAVVQASVIDTGSGQVVQELKGTYRLNDISLLAKALTATVTGAFHLRAGVSLELVSVAAYPWYIQGINLLRRDGVSADEAIPFLQKASDLDPRSPLPYAGLAEAQVQKFQRGYGAEWLDRAAQSVAKAQSLNADTPPVLKAAGLYKQQHGWYEQAAQDFNRALELAPNDAEAWNRLASAYAGMNRTDEAIATYQKAIAALPDYYAPYMELGTFYLNRGQFHEAEGLYRQATAVAPGFARGHMDLGLALKQQGRLQAAEQSLLTSLQLLPSPSVLTNLGALYYQEERYSEAARYFERSVQATTPNAIPFWNLADAYRQLGRNAEASEMYRKAQAMSQSDLIQNPRDAVARVGLAYSLAQLGVRDQAEFEVLQALGMGPGNATVTREAAFTFEALRERDQTLRVLATAPAPLVQELSQQPDLKELQGDSRFQDLLRNRMSQP